MGWMWEEEKEENIASPNPNFRSMDEGDGDMCATRRVVRSNCTTEEVEPGKFVRKCDKTEQILRDCIGRPAEVIESHSEHTEEDITNQIKNGDSFSLDISTDNHTFSFPGFRNDIESMEKELMGNLDEFLKETEKMTGGFFKEAEKMTGDLFKSFGLGIERNERGNEVKSFDSEKKDDSIYSEFAGKIRDV
ncbi:hypothetical protein LUZ60_001514 [Juncus effusus]|nr:hypothetical protein LUZ60_001514 [Juncus effusus]